MTEAEIAWLAGFLEGEGTFYTKRQQGGQYLLPIIKVGGTDRDVIQRAGQLLGGTALQFERRRKDHWKDQWKVHVYGQRAVDVMQQVLPWMGQRRAAKIREVIAIWEERPRRVKVDRPLDLAVRARRWARQQGLTISERGRIPTAVWAAFKAAHPTPL